jgi:hypothetical protein
MIRDAYNIYSNLQAVTATADSTNTIDQLKAGDAYSSMWLRVRAETAFAGGTSLAINLLTADDTAFSVNLVTYPVLATTVLASLTGDTVLAQFRIPPGMRRYHKLNYVVVGTMTAGTINAELVTDVPTNRRGTKFGYLG